VSDTSPLIDRLLSPKVVFGALLALIVLTLICTPEIDPGQEESRLTTYSNDQEGARGLYLLAERLGWPVERRITPLRTTLDTAATYAVLAPVTGFTASEVNRLLEAVRAGASLLYVIPFGGSPLTDSLQLEPTAVSFRGLSAPDDPPPLASEQYERFADLYDGVPRRALEQKGPRHGDTRIFVAAVGFGDSLGLPVVIGLPLGAGRIVAVADPALLRNDVIRDGDYALLPVRVLEWLSPEERRRIVFDEFHQGFGEHPSLFRAVQRLLLGTPPGRAIATLGVALLLLLVAAATRAIPPRALRRIERRSPLEHVGALARAYEQVSATRLAARRLVHGVRRRHATGAARALDDESWLRALVTRHPQLAPDVDRTIVALHRNVPPADFLGVGQSIAHIDRTLGT
jgi:hypothetical protein